MKLIIGLGNPGKKYEHTRHNAGFLAIDAFVKKLGFEIGNLKLENKFNSEILEINNSPQPPLNLREGEKTPNSFRLLLAKPQTFMNNSGQAVQSMKAFYKIGPETDLLVVHDDIDLPLGAIRPSFDASSAGHKGVQDIIDKLGTQKFHRLRIGVETRENKNDEPTEVFVLRDFSPAELETFRKTIAPAATSELEKFIAK